MRAIACWNSGAKLADLQFHTFRGLIVTVNMQQSIRSRDPMATTVDEFVQKLRSLYALLDFTDNFLLGPRCLRKRQTR
jgi:hypothetical protein